MPVLFAIKAADLLLHATWHYEAHRFDQALLGAFPAAGAVLRELWGRHVDQRDVEIRGANGEYRLTAERRRRLVGSEFTVNVLLETMALSGLLDEVSYRKARHATTRQRFGAPRRSCVGS